MILVINICICILLDCLQTQLQLDQQLQMILRRNWTEQEDQIIRKSISQRGITKWPKMLQYILKDYPGFSRNAKQIRERWKYHLDPEITHSSWTEEEEEIIFKIHMRYGSRWKEIHKRIPNRTEKAIKNYFYMTLRKSIRQIGKLVGIKNSTNLVRELKPFVLSTIVECANQDPQLRQIISRMFHFYRLQSESRNNIVAFQGIINEMLYFNELYILDKSKAIEMLKTKLQDLKSACFRNANLGKNERGIDDTTTARLQLEEEQLGEEEIVEEDEIGENQQIVQSLRLKEKESSSLKMDCFFQSSLNNE